MISCNILDSIECCDYTVYLRCGDVIDNNQYLLKDKFTNFTLALKYINDHLMFEILL